MKTHYSNRITNLPFLCMGLTLLCLISVPHWGWNAEPATATIQTATQTDDNDFIEQIVELINTKKHAEAKTQLDAYIEKKSKEKIPPYVSGKYLYMYSSGNHEIILFSQLQSKPEGKNKEILQKYYPWYFDLNIEPGTSVIFEHPNLPRAYYYRAYIAIEKKQFREATDDLMKAIKTWPMLSEAHCEIVYLLIRSKQYELAKKLGEKSLSKYLDFNKDHKAKMMRHLGFIAIEENELDRAEKYFTDCLQLIPNQPNALEELEYIQQLRDKKKSQPGK